MRRWSEDDSQTRWNGVLGSLLVHALLIGLLVNQFRSASRGSPAKQAPKALLITLAMPAPTPPRVVQPPTPKPVERPKEVLQVVPTPTPIPAAAPPKPQPKPQVPKKPTPPTPAAAAPKQAVEPPPETPEESLIGRIHDNWLEPARMPREFRCRIRIDYQLGGRIVGVSFRQGCGNAEIESSVSKAVWKTGTLPLTMLNASAPTGTIEFEFTP